MSSPLDPRPYHILAYGVLLGSQVFNSFISGIVAYRALPRPQFAQLQTAQFPIYFALQTLLPAALAATYPGRAVSGRIIPSGTTSSTSGWRAPALLTVAALGAVNWAVLGPATTRVMRTRKHQETRDGRRSYDPPPHSEAMQSLNRRFAVLHGASSLVNLVAVLATVAYGFELGARIV